MNHGRRRKTDPALCPCGNVVPQDHQDWHFCSESCLWKGVFASNEHNPGTGSCPECGHNSYRTPPDPVRRFFLRLLRRQIVPVCAHVDIEQGGFVDEAHECACVDEWHPLWNNSWLRAPSR